MKSIRLILNACALLFITTSAFAQSTGGGQIGFGPLSAASPIPTLSETMLVVLGLLMATFAYRALLKNKSDSTKLMSISLIAISALTLGYGGVKFIDNADATTPLVPLLVDGSPVEIQYGTLQYRNDTGAKTKIQFITANADASACANPLPSGITDECTVGQVLEINEICNIRCDFPGPSDA